MANYSYHPTIITDEQLAEVSRLLSTTTNKSELARLVNAPRLALSRAMKKKGLVAKPPERRTTPEEQKQILAEYQTGESQKQVGERHGMKQTTIGKIIRRAGETSRAAGGRRKPVTAEQVAEIVELYKVMSQEKIGKKMNIGQTVVSAALRLVGGTDSHRWGPNHQSWKGGRRTKEDGYVEIWISPDDPLRPMCRADGYVLEHRYVMATTLGSPLLRSEQVHHKDCNRQNNTPDNLQLIQGHHGQGAVYVCCDCGSHNITPADLEMAA